MLPEAKFYLKFYSIAVIGILGFKIFFSKKTTAVDLAALIPTFVLICNM